MQLIGLTGRAGTGKDTIADFLVETHGFVKLAFADPIKDGIKAMLGLSGDDITNSANKEDKVDWLGCSPRHAMQTLGTDWGRDMIHPNLWLNITARRVHKIMAMPAMHHIAGIVISDVRFENEADWVRAHGGQVWHVRRAACGLAGATATHISEQTIPRHAADRIIANDGSTEQTFELVCELIDLLERNEGAAA